VGCCCALVPEKENLRYQTVNGCQPVHPRTVRLTHETGDLVCSRFALSHRHGPTTRSASFSIFSSCRARERTKPGQAAELEVPNPQPLPWPFGHRAKERLGQGAARRVASSVARERGGSARPAGEKSTRPGDRQVKGALRMRTDLSAGGERLRGSSGGSSSSLRRRRLCHLGSQGCPWCPLGEMSFGS
jgi:hypothetical protein